MIYRVEIWYDLDDKFPYISKGFWCKRNAVAYFCNAPAKYKYLFRFGKTLNFWTKMKK